jgi:hypothetical protein
MEEEIIDARFYLIQIQLIKFTQMDFEEVIPVSEKGDEIDAIIVGMNTLGEELKALQIKGIINK